MYSHKLAILAQGIADLLDQRSVSVIIDDNLIKFVRAFD
jgi:hypothetical protein